MIMKSEDEKDKDKIAAASKDEKEKEKDDMDKEKRPGSEIGLPTTQKQLELIDEMLRAIDQVHAL